MKALACAVVVASIAFSKGPASASPTSGTPTGKMARLRVALKALDDQLAKLATAAHAAKTRADACKGVDKLPPLYEVLRKPDLLAGPAKAKDWAMRLDDLGMAIGDTTDNKCGPDSTAEVEDLQDCYESLRKNVSDLLALCK